MGVMVLTPRAVSASAERPRVLGCSRTGVQGSSGSALGCSDCCLFSPLQNEMLNRQIQKEIWRIQDVMEGLRKNNPSRGTDTAKHRGEQGPSLPWHGTNPSVPRHGVSPAPLLS